jgi:hypothetical protein
MPQVGMRASVRYLATDVPAVVVGVEDEGRCLKIRTDQGELIEFKLNRATGKYQTPGSGPRLTLEP